MHSDIAQFTSANNSKVWLGWWYLNIMRCNMFVFPSTSSSFIFPNSLISCCYCYFAHVTLLSQRVKLISHFLLLSTSSPSPSLSTVCAQLYIFHLIFSLSLTFVFSFLLLYFLLFTSSPCPSIHQLSALPSPLLTSLTLLLYFLPDFCIFYLPFVWSADNNFSALHYIIF